MELTIVPREVKTMLIISIIVIIIIIIIILFQTRTPIIEEVLTKRYLYYLAALHYGIYFAYNRKIILQLT